MVLEEQLFEINGGWDGDHEFMTLYDCVSKVEIGGRPIGTRFDHVSFRYTDSTLVIPCEPFNGDYEYFQLRISVGDRIPLTTPPSNG